MHFGEMLRHARETSGVALDSVTAKTRIPRRYLEALERGDLSILPGGAFDKGYIKTIADLLEVDPRPILDAYGAEVRRLGQETTESDQRPLRDLEALVPKKRRRSRPWIRFAIAAAIGSVAAGVLISRTSRPPEDSPAGGDAAPEASPSPAPEFSPAPDREPRGPSPQAILSSPGSLTVAGAAFGTAVVDRRLTGTADRFSAGTRVLFWTRVGGGQSGEMLRHVWLHEGQAVMRASLAIGGPHWRTFSALTLPRDAAGTWTVEARDPDGRVLAREQFLCLPPSP
jgi:Helix-turn-helix domain/Protein of unknown function (DUF2914)